jgi:hypothetical protein
VAIAADTAFAIENSQNNHLSSSSSSSCLTLLITLTTGGQQKRDNKQQQQQQQRDARTAIDGTSDILIATSCIDTVVTLRSRGVRNEVTTAVGENNNNSNSNKNIEDYEVLNSWKKKSVGETKKNLNSKQKDSNRSNDHDNNSENRNDHRDDDTINTTTAAPDDDSDETILVHSLWQAEIQGQNHYDDDDDDKRNKNNGASIVDYAFVETLPSLGNDENDDRESEKELRWKVS